jgi:DNA mismatch repair protein MutL
MYIVAEGPAGMFLIDQHAAHERILYEHFMDRRYGLIDDAAPRQHLLEPVTLHAGGEIAGMVATHLQELTRVGFEIEPFGTDAFLVRAVPGVLAGDDPQASLLDIVTSLASGRNLVGVEFESQLVKMVCKRAAVKAGQLLSDIEMQELLRQLEECRSPRTCPHGRPTMIQLSAGELERAFGRV